MAETSMFFDSTAEDRRRYSSAAFAKFMRLFYSDGVVTNGGNSLQVRKSSSNLSITVDTGSAIVQGYAYFNEDAPLSLPVTAAHASLPRIDRVVLRLDLTLSARDISAAILTGTPAASPTPPALTRTENVWELSLAQLRIPANAVTIQTVTDERLDADVCGISEGLYTLDASEFESRAEEILNELSSQGYVTLTEYNSKVNQNVKTTASPTFAGLTVTGAINGKADLATNADNASKLGGVGPEGYQKKVTVGTSVPSSLAEGEIFVLI